jgi:Scaffold protein Nfu/NifU N terminal
MAVIVAPSPNPNAMKFTVGAPVGGPATHLAGATPEEPFLVDLLRLPGVTSIFLTADFVTISKSPDTDWESIVPDATEILEREFGG